MRMFFCEPRIEFSVLFIHWPARVIFVISHHIRDRLLPVPQELIERIIISKGNNIACQDHDIPAGVSRQHPTRAKFKMQIAVSDDSHACLFWTGPPFQPRLSVR